VLARRRLIPLAIRRTGTPPVASSRRQKRTAAVWRTLDLEVEGDTVWVPLTDGVQVIEVLADVELAGRSAVLRGLHIQGGSRNTLGQRALRKLIN